MEAGSMTDADMAASQVTVMLDEYKEIGTETRTRIDLQHRNMNVLVVLVTAVTGYLVKYASEHGLGTHGASLAHSEIAILVALVPVVTNVFLWRHLDHDVNIIDKAAYVRTVLRPALVESLEGRSVLDFESFLHFRRKLRPQRWGPFLALGQEDVPMFLILVSYLGASWYLLLHVQHHAGSGHDVFDGLVYVGTLLTAISAVMAVGVGREYARVGADDDVSRRDLAEWHAQREAYNAKLFTEGRPRSDDNAEK
jgi:hypothetical protein